jgi:hypothetical protein
MNYVPKHNPQDPLPRSATIRGAYINSGSRDIGPDIYDDQGRLRQPSHKQ